MALSANPTPAVQRIVNGHFENISDELSGTLISSSFD
jgi:hypothetical protein